MGISFLSILISKPASGLALKESGFDKRLSYDIWSPPMTWDIILGIALTIFALGAVVFLTLWCRRIIEQIHAHRPGSLRHIQKDILDGNNSRNKS